MTSRNRFLLASTSLVGILSLVYLLLYGGEERTGPGEHVLARSSPERERAEESEADLLPSAENAGRRNVPTPTKTPQPPQRESASRTVTSPQVFSGQLVVRERDGTDNHVADGSFTLWLWNEDDRREFEIEVIQGSWKLSLIPKGNFYTADGQIDRGPKIAAGFKLDTDDAEVTARSPRFGDAPVRFVKEQGRLTLNTPDLVFFAERLQPTVLRVVDAESGIPLNDITLVESDSWFGRRNGPPTIGDIRNPELTGLNSPIEVPIGESAKRYLVWSPGYAWNNIKLQQEGGGTRLIELKPGSSLQIELTGAYQQKNLRLRLWKNDDLGQAPLSEWLAASEQRPLIQGLHQGEYTLRCELGKWHENPVRLAEATVVVTPSQVAQAELRVAEHTQLQLVPMAGNFELPNGWDINKVQLQLALATEGGYGRSKPKPLPGPWKRVPGSAQRYAWDAGMMEAGEYWMAVNSTGHQENFVLNPGGDTDILIRVGPPIKVRVRTIEVGTGQEIGNIAFHWSVRHLGSAVYNFNSTRTSIGSSETYVMVPMGLITFSLWGNLNYGYLNRDVQVRGPMVVTLELKQAIKVTIQYRDGEHLIPFPGHTSLFNEGVEHLNGDGQGKITSRGSSSDGTAILSFSQAGRYSIPMPDVAGFEPIGKF